MITNNNKLILKYKNNKIKVVKINNENNIKVEYITINPSLIEIKVGEIVQLTADILPSNASNKNVTWQSYNEGFATVTKDGLVTALHEGSLVIRCISQEDPNIYSECELTITKDNTIEPPSDLAIMNKVPFISTYYINPINDINEDIIINYYVTDYEQKEYLSGDDSERFTIDYWVNEVKYSIANVRPGDNTINIGKLKEGDYTFDLQATDYLGRKSHKLFYDIMVIDKVADDVDILSKTYNVTESDLAIFGIKKDNTEPIATTLGLNNLIIWAKEQGYRKIILPFGTYANDKDSCVDITVDDFILDLNGSTFKLEPNNYANTMQIKIKNCRNSNVINGIIEGDLLEHDFATATDNSEWVHGVEIGSSEYCFFKDITLKNITGYGTTTLHTQSTSGENVSNWVSGDLINGELVENEFRVSSQGKAALQKWRTDLNPPRLLHDFTRETGTGYVQYGMPYGYQGNITDNWVLKVSFYDKDDIFIESVETYAYRRTRVPLCAMYVRLTVYSQTIPSSSSAGLGCVRFPMNGGFVNVHHEDVRCCGTALCATNNFLMEGNSYSHCGWSAANCAFNTEDGWDHTQDLHIRKSKFLKGNGQGNNPPGTDNGNVNLCCSGHNIVIEDELESGCYIYERVRNFVFRNNIVTANTIEYRSDGLNRSGYARIYGNECYKPSNIKSNSDNTVIVVKDSNYYDGNIINGRTGGEGRLVRAIRCSFENTLENSSSGGTFVSTTLDNCTFKNMTNYVNSDCIFNECTFDNVAMRPNTQVSPGIYNDCTFNNYHGIYSASSCCALYNRCSFEDLRFNCSGGNTIDNEIVFTDCEINWNELNTIGLFKSTSTSFYIRFVNCIINDVSNKPIVEHSKSGDIKGKITFDNCTINKTQGVIVHDNYADNYHGSATDLNIHLINTPISIPIGNANVINNPNIWKVVVE